LNVEVPADSDVPLYYETKMDGMLLIDYSMMDLHDFYEYFLAD